VLFARAEVNHITGDVYYLALGLPRRNLVVTMHDARILLCLPGLRRAIFRRLWFEWPCSRARFVVFISEASQRELETALGHPIPNARVIPNPASPEFQYAPRRSTPPSRALLIGTKTNKNIERTARALEASLHGQVIGKLSEPQRAQLDASRIDCRPAGLTGRPGEAGLIDCDLLCFASTYEGFGVPIIEARVGRPSGRDLCRRAHVRVAGGRRGMVDPLDVDSFARVCCG
jgi:glycosyltransferase involved in cell wall biosynthesis